MDSVKDQFLSNGYAILRGAFSKDYIQKLYNQLDVAGMHSGSFTDEQGFLKVGDLRWMLPLEIRGDFNSPEFYSNATVWPLLSELLGKEIIVNSMGLVVSESGADDQRIHRDHPNCYEKLNAENLDVRLPYAITLIIPLVELSSENGCTSLFAGSHLLSEGFTEEVVYSTQLGDCILMDYRLLHRGRKNLSQDARPIVYSVYGRPWFRDTVNFRKLKPLNFSEGERKKIPAEFKKLFEWYFNEPT